MRIILDTSLNTGTAEYQNFGDVAMLQVAVARLTKLWPSASIEVITESPENLAIYCPGTKALPRAGRNLWIGNTFILGRLHKYYPKLISIWLEKIVKYLERSRPRLLRQMVRLRLALRDDENIKNDLMPFIEAMEHADLLIVSGAGGFGEGTRNWDMPILGILETAIRRRITTAMMGQGMESLKDSEVLSKAKIVFPAVNLITLRGGRRGLNLIESIGVDPSHVMITGDEAVELAYDARPEKPGEALGINLRNAFYAYVDQGLIEMLRSVLQEFARRYAIPMIPIPIAVHPWANDHYTIQQLLSGFDDQSDGGLTLDTPVKIIKQTGRCRIVVTGAYHAAVFALAQGIPAVCLAKSPYYVAKFLGLKEQFDIGCEAVFLDDSDLSVKISAAMERAWQSADSVKLPLLQAAIRQIDLSRSAYERVREFVNARRFVKDRHSSMINFAQL